MGDAWWRDADEFQQRWEAAGWNLTVLANTHEMASTTINRWKAKHGLEFPEHVKPQGNHRRIAATRDAPPPLVPIIDEEVRLEGDYAVMSDMHLPVTRYDVVERWLDDAERAGLTRAILPGDTFNQDRWSRHEHKQGGAGPEEEMAAALWAFTQMLDVFDELVIALGNHDESLHRKLDYAVTFDKAMRMMLAGIPPEGLERITITGRDYVLVDTDDGLWRICHTRAYSRQPLAYPNRLALRHGCHVAGAHRHHHAQGYSANGKRIVELGGAFDEDRMAYANRWTDDFPMMQNGYMLLVDGRAICPMLRD
jgi:hypothetical protein